MVGALVNSRVKFAGWLGVERANKTKLTRLTHLASNTVPLASDILPGMLISAPLNFGDN